MQQTIRAKIEDQSIYLVLEEMGKHMGCARRKFFVGHGIQKKSITELKRAFIAEEGLTARQFNSISYEVRGLLKAHQELKRDLILKTQKQIQKIKKKLKKEKSPFIIHQFKRQLYQKAVKLASYQGHLKRPSICFGEKKLFQKQFHLKENGYKSHAKWKEEWNQARDRSFFLIGSKDESFGNQSCQFLPGRLKLRLTHSLAEKMGKDSVEIPVQVTYRQDELQAALQAKQAIHYRFIHAENGYWYVHITIDLPEVPQKTHARLGALGIDLNPACIAVTVVDSYGNYQSSWQIPVQLRGKSTEQVSAILGEHCSQLVGFAKDQKIPIVIEELDFENKKQQLRSRKMNRMLSYFAYSPFSSIITTQCYRQGVQLIAVNPAYTSVIGKVKFSYGYGLSTHVGAAMAVTSHQNEPPFRG